MNPALPEASSAGHRPGLRETPAPVRVHVPDHLVRCLIIASCFPFTGWLAVRHSWRVNHRLEAGDFDGARRERKQALRWYRISAGLLILLLLAAVLVLVNKVVLSDLDAAY